MSYNMTFPLISRGWWSLSTVVVATVEAGRSVELVLGALWWPNISDCGRI